MLFSIMTLCKRPLTVEKLGKIFKDENIPNLLAIIPLIEDENADLWINNLLSTHKYDQNLTLLHGIMEGLEMGKPVTPGKLLVINKLLAVQGIEIDKPDSVFGRTPFLSAVKQGNYDVACLLYKHEADVHHVSNNGSTALHHVVYFLDASLFVDKSVEIAKFLIDAGVDVTLKNNNNLDFIQLLLISKINREYTFKAMTDILKYIQEKGKRENNAALMEFASRYLNTVQACHDYLIHPDSVNRAEGSNSLSSDYSLQPGAVLRSHSTITIASVPETKSSDVEMIVKAKKL